MPAEEDELQVNMVGRISIPEAKYGRVALADKIVFVGINFQSNFSTIKNGIRGSHISYINVMNRSTAKEKLRLPPKSVMISR